jgi:hypothetical protein
MGSFLAKHEPSNDGTLEAFAIGVRTWSIGHAFKVLPTAPPGDAGEGKYPRAAWREALKHACLRIRSIRLSSRIVRSAIESGGIMSRLNEPLRSLSFMYH